MVYYPEEIEYSDKFQDDFYEYRHVTLPERIYKKIKSFSTEKLLTEVEWRGLGVQQSKGWEHFMIFKKEPHILNFRRPIGTDPNTGFVPTDIQLKIQSWEKYRKEYL